MQNTLFFATYKAVMERFLFVFRYAKSATIAQAYKYAQGKLTEDSIKEHIKKHQTAALKGEKNKDVSTRSISYREETREAFETLYEPFKNKFFHYQVMSAAIELYLEDKPYDYGN